MGAMYVLLLSSVVRRGGWSRVHQPTPSEPTRVGEPDEREGRKLHSWLGGSQIEAQCICASLYASAV